MDNTRRRITTALAAAPSLLLPTHVAQAAEPLKLSHQFPGGSETEGDFRHRLSLRFAQELAKRSNGALKVNVYPGSSLMKVNAQLSAARKGALDLTLIPLPYGGGEIPELNIALMPGLVTSYEQGFAWKKAEIGKALTDLLADKGLVLVTWIWQAGGAASRAAPVIGPEDVKALKYRGGSREMDMVAKAAGATTLSLPSSETYAAMQTGAVDVVMTSATSLISFRLQEVSKHLTISKSGKSYWFMLEPLLMSKTVFDNLPKDQQALVMTVGAEMEKFGLDGARADDAAVAAAYTKAGAQVHELNDAALAKWVALSRTTAWKDYAEKNAGCARLLKLAEKAVA